MSTTLQIMSGTFYALSLNNWEFIVFVVLSVSVNIFNLGQNLLSHSQ